MVEVVNMLLRSLLEKSVMTYTVQGKDTHGHHILRLRGRPVVPIRLVKSILFGDFIILVTNKLFVQIAILLYVEVAILNSKLAFINCKRIKANSVTDMVLT